MPGSLTSRLHIYLFEPIEPNVFAWHSVLLSNRTFSLPTFRLDFKVDGSSHPSEAMTSMSRRYLWNYIFLLDPVLPCCQPSFPVKVSSMFDNRKHFVPVAFGSGYLMTTPSVSLDMISNALLKNPRPVNHARLRTTCILCSFSCAFRHEDVQSHSFVYPFTLTVSCGF